MRGAWQCAVLACVATGSLFASMDGTVVNQTTGQPAAGVSVTLVKPGQAGMQTIGTTVSDSTGHFRFEKDQPGGGPQLLQATYKGINYNKLMTPNIPTSGVELDVYEASASPETAHVAEQMVLLEPSANQTGVDQTVIVQNQTKTTYHNPALGSLRFYLPAAVTAGVQVRAQGPQGMPLPQVAQKTKEPGVFQVNFPLKPGETEFDISYALPAGAPMTYKGRVTGVAGMPTTPLRLIAPAGVTIAGKDLQNVGTEPKTGATIYTVTAKDDFAAEITGTGSLRPPADAPAVDTSDQPPITTGPPQIYSHLAWLVGLAFAVFAVGLVMLFRSSPVQSPYRK